MAVENTPGQITTFRNLRQKSRKTAKGEQKLRCDLALCPLFILSTIVTICVIYKMLKNLKETK